MERPHPSTIPTTPGIYLYKDAQGRIIYVGKARNLRKRVLSYFREPARQTAKTRAMLAHAASVDTLSTGTEKEALLLEASLIKKHHPHYNIVLRDDKQYVLFRVAHDVPFPRLEIVRKTKKDRARYFGPFTSGLSARETWKTIHRAFPLRRCTDRAMANRSRPCLYYDLGQCLAPCVKDVEPAAYAELVQRVEMFLAGRSRELLNGLNAAMHEASEAMEFERAAALRDQIRAVRATVERQSVVLADGGDMDVAGLVEVGGGLGLGLLFVREGKLVDGRTFFWNGLGAEDKPELLWSFLGQFYSNASGRIPPRLVVPELGGEEAAPERKNAESETAGDAESEDSQIVAREALEALLGENRGGIVRVRPPRGPAERALVEMAESNARESVRGDNRSLPARLAAAFHAPFPVRRVACVDVSHTGGEATRVGLVFFEDGRPLKSEYRTYAIQGTGGDDYAALTLWAARYAARHTESGNAEESAPDGGYCSPDGQAPEEIWPDLLLIDGGRGQVASVAHAFREAGIGGEDGTFPFLLAGIAKARTEEGRADRRAGNVGDRIFPAGRSNPLPLRDGAPELLFLQRVRDEAHRFSISRHRKARSRQSFASELTSLPCVGPVMARRLWDAFGTLEGIVDAGVEKLAAVPGIGPAKAGKLVEGLRALKEKKDGSAGG